MKKRGFFSDADAFGNSYLLKRLMIVIFGSLSHWRFTRTNKTIISGTENLENLPDRGVLFVSNHQTYFAEVAMMYQVFSAIKQGKKNTIEGSSYLLNPRLNIYFIAALETMRKGILPKMFEHAGSVSIKRTWREAGQDVNRQVDLKDISKIGMAIDHGWVITFPQGTTTPFVKGRRGTSHVIKKYKPIVVPIVLDGFDKAFDKKGLRIKRRNTKLTMQFKAPLKIDYDAKSDDILKLVMDAIEQSERFKPQKLA
jgi:1-acyl-sn-glycerol-3-phosphate acyltransferase